MINGFLDIPYDQILAYMKDVKKTNREDICKVVPRGRFNIESNGNIRYSGLVCKDINGKSTGAVANWCENCKIQ